MNIIFEVGHPSHVYMFKNAIAELRERGHAISVVAVSKEMTTELLKLHGLDYVLVGNNNPTLVGKALTLPLKNLALIRKVSPSKPDLIVSTDSPYSAHASSVLGIPHIAFGDTETAITIIRLMLPFTDAICTPSCFTLNLGLKQVRYEGYKALAYLHPNRFRPNPATLDRIGVRPDDRLIVVRFGAMNASHDVGHHGLRLESAQDKLEFVQALEEYGTVLVTSEVPLKGKLEKKMPKVPFDKIHDILYYASLYIGDGATMASEAGVLGTPWIYVSDAELGCLVEQQHRYGLGFREKSAEAALTRAAELLRESRLKSEWQARRDKMLKEKIDVTEFMVDFIDNWPDSFVHQAQPLPNRDSKAAAIRPER